jgi:nitrogen fixation NifU-like protein
VGACAVVVENRFEQLHCFGQGCAISKASASLMTDVLQGKTTQDFYALFLILQSALKGDAEALKKLESYGDLAALGGVRNYPMRVKCATLGWQSLKSVIEGGGGSLSVQ